MGPSGFRVIDFGGRGGLEHKLVQRESIFHPFWNLKSQPAKPRICPKDLCGYQDLKGKKCVQTLLLGCFCIYIYPQAFSLTFHFQAAGDELHRSRGNVWRKMWFKKKIYITHKEKKGMLLYFPRLPLHIFSREACQPADPGIEHEAPPETRFQPVRVFMCLPGGRSRHVLPDCGIRRLRLRWAGRRRVAEALSSARHDGGCCCYLFLCSSK